MVNLITKIRLAKNKNINSATINACGIASDINIDRLGSHNIDTDKHLSF